MLREEGCNLCRRACCGGLRLDLWCSLTPALSEVVPRCGREVRGIHWALMGYRVSASYCDFGVRKVTGPVQELLGTLHHTCSCFHLAVLARPCLSLSLNIHTTFSPVCSQVGWRHSVLPLTRDDVLQNHSCVS